MGIGNIIHQLYFKTTGYSYTHLGRLFLRMFVGIMLMQFGVGQLMGEANPRVMLYLPYLSYGLPTLGVIILEIICPFLIMIGFFTRIAIIAPMILLIVSCQKSFILAHTAFGGWNPTFLIVQFMFLGIFTFLLLVGPGKISTDYFYSLYLINRQHGKEEDLEEV